MRRKTKHKADQFELPFANSPFNLAGEACPAAAAPAAAPAADLVDPRQGSLDKVDYCAPEYKVSKVRDCAWPSEKMMDNPEPAAAFWRAHIESAAWYRSEQECLCVLMLNTRRKLLGFHLVTLGTLDTCYGSTLEVFRVAIMKAAPAIIIAHNHPSGDPSPSEADIKCTRDWIRAGQLLKIQLLDSIIIGKPTEQQSRGWTSLRELGYFYS